MTTVTDFVAVTEDGRTTLADAHGNNDPQLVCIQGRGEVDRNRRMGREPSERSVCLTSL